MKNLWLGLFCVTALAMFGCGDSRSSGNSTENLDSRFPNEITVDGETYTRDRNCKGTLIDLSNSEHDPRKLFFLDLSDNDTSHSWYVTYRSQRGRTTARGEVKCSDFIPYGLIVSVVRYPSADAASQALSKNRMKDSMWAKGNLLFAANGNVSSQDKDKF